MIRPAVPALFEGSGPSLAVHSVGGSCVLGDQGRVVLHCAAFLAVSLQTQS